MDNTEAIIQCEVRDGPFIARLHEYASNSNHLWIVMEYYNGRDLQYYFNKYQRFSEELVIRICAELLLALEYIHDRGIIHGDVKLANILLDDRGHVKLTDFGLSRRITEKNVGEASCDIPPYTSPEKVQKVVSPFGFDDGSFGIVMYFMLTGIKLPFDRPTVKDSSERIKRQRCLIYPEHLSPDAKDILVRLLVTDSKSRLGCDGVEQIRNHPFFKSVKWDEVRNSELKAQTVLRSKKTYKALETSVNQ